MNKKWKIASEIEERIIIAIDEAKKCVDEANNHKKVEIEVVRDKMKDCCEEIIELARLLEIAGIKREYCITSLQLKTDKCTIRWIPFDISAKKLRGTKPDVVFGMVPNDFYYIKDGVKKPDTPECSLFDYVFYILEGKGVEDYGVC